MKQNKYDDPDFFDIYSKMPRSAGGLAQAEEWPLLRTLLPDLRGKTFLDLGCGYGWHCRYARSQGASRVVGVDISERMLERAHSLTAENNIEYHRAAIEDYEYTADSFDVVFSSLALHYIKDYVAVCEKVYKCLKPQGCFVMSVEHPVFTALPKQDWYYDENGNILHWPLDDYQNEGIRHTSWLADNVIKYHRTLQTYINNLIDSGFCITSLVEPRPSADILLKKPEFKNECRRPLFLLLAAIRKD